MILSGDPALLGEGMTPNEDLTHHVSNVERGMALSDVDSLIFRDPKTFCAGELHNHLPIWERLASRNPSNAQTEVLDWLKKKVSVFSYF